ncbi:MAG: HEAT repeat domain-containing protein [Candidatus Omnitrophica bacterium]|nr:HEAT repeat domain-containing protein [Candidatus Omnitrophota bacterium]
MYNYHPDIILKIDIGLFIASIILAVIILAYIRLKEYADRVRDKNLIEIKNNLYKFTLSGKSDMACFNMAGRSTVQQLLDIEGNRRREAVFFNRSEQELFKKCLIASKSVGVIEKTAMRSGNKWRRIEAIIALGHLGTEGAEKIIKNALLSTDTDTRYFSAMALGRIKTKASAGILLDLLKKDRLIRRKVVSLLETFPAGDASDAAIEMTGEKDPNLRFWILKLLAKLKPAKYRKQIEKLLDDTSDDVRAAACECLGAIGDKASEPALIKCLSDDAWLVRMHSVKALSAILADRSISIIINSINDGSLFVLESVRDAMKEHIRAAMPHIKKIFEGKDDFGKKICIEAMESALMESDDPGLHSEVIGSLRSFDPAVAGQIENRFRKGRR